MIHSNQLRELANRGRVAAQLVCADPLRCSACVAKQHLEEALGSFRIPLLLEENIERGAVLVDRAPQPVLLASGRHRLLVQVPHASAPRLALAQLSRELRAELLEVSRRSTRLVIGGARRDSHSAHPVTELTVLALQGAAFDPRQATGAVAVNC
jgi:hypothetical protein